MTEKSHQLTDLLAADQQQEDQGEQQLRAQQCARQGHQRNNNNTTITTTVSTTATTTAETKTTTMRVTTTTENQLKSAYNILRWPTKRDWRWPQLVGLSNWRHPITPPTPLHLSHSTPRTPHRAKRWRTLLAFGYTCAAYRKVRADPNFLVYF